LLRLTEAIWPAGLNVNVLDWSWLVPDKSSPCEVSRDTAS
jgi:hypothetical protein